MTFNEALLWLAVALFLVIPLMAIHKIEKTGRVHPALVFFAFPSGACSITCGILACRLAILNA